MATKQQIKNDFNYLRNNVNDYAIDEDLLVNYVVPKLENYEMDNKEFIIWCMKDLWSYVYADGDDDSIEFLETDKRAIRIKERYNIELDEHFNPNFE